MFVPVDRPYLVVVGQHLVHAAETSSVVASTTKARRLTPVDRWRVPCDAAVSKLATTAAVIGAEPLASPWPPPPALLERYGPACPSCTAVAG